MTGHWAFRLVCLCFCIPVVAGAPKTDATGLLWVAEKEGVRVYLWGLAHNPPKEYEETPAVVFEAMRRSSLVLSELPDGLAWRETSMPAALHGFAARSYKNEGFALDVQSYTRLEELAQTGHLSPLAAQSLIKDNPYLMTTKLRSALAASRIRKGELRQPYLTGGTVAPDRHLLAVAQQLGKKVLPLEWPGVNVGYYNRLCDDERHNSALLKMEIDIAFDDETLMREYMDTARALYKGEWQRLQELVWMAADQYPEGKAVIDQCDVAPRNRDWITRLKEGIASKPTGPIFLFGGFLHFLSARRGADESVLGLLRAEGWRISQVATEKDL